MSEFVYETRMLFFRKYNTSCQGEIHEKQLNFLVNDFTRLKLKQKGALIHIGGSKPLTTFILQKVPERTNLNDQK